MTTQDDGGKSQAEAQLASVKVLAEWLAHTGNCEGEEDCTLLDETHGFTKATAQIIADAFGIYPVTAVTADNFTEYHEPDKARERIEEDALSVEVRTDWHAVGAEDDKPTEYNILLCTGGPAVRIIGRLTEYGEPETASIEYQDWFKPWTRLPIDGDDEDALLAYASVFWFGE